MTAAKDKFKTTPEINSGNLLFLCRARKLSIAGLARQIKRSRQAVYYAIENPRRYSITFRKIRNALL
jgi:hypothetical protein